MKLPDIVKSVGFIAFKPASKTKNHYHRHGSAFKPVTLELDAAESYNATFTITFQTSASTLAKVVLGGDSAVDWLQLWRETGSQFNRRDFGL